MRCHRKSNQAVSPKVAGCLRSTLAAVPFKAATQHPGSSSPIIFIPEQLIQHCPECTKALASPRQPMLPTPLPEYPWQRVASDLFELNKKTYILVADYFSRYVEVQTLTSTTSASVIRVLKSIFVRHSILETLVSDNGPQCASQ